MKKVWMAGLAVLALGACSADGGSLNSGLDMGNSLVKAAVDNQCRTELNKRNEWRLAMLTQSAAQQQAWEDKICGCASEEAVQQLSANDMMQMVNTSTRNQAIANVTARTVTACVQRLYR